MTSNEDPRLERLKREVAHLPTSPGVYLMRDSDANVIYVGKAKDLRSRVRTYFAGGDGRYQIAFLVKRVAALETIITQTEQQAFLLERDLITKYKPRYNIKLKDDRAYLSIRLDENSEWPRVELVRKVSNDGARYFGPYAFSSELRNLLEAVKRVIPLRSCTDTTLYNRTRPCLEFQIKRCCAPCCLPIERETYLKYVKEAVAILEGRSAATVKRLEQLMESASEDLRFEEAAAWRDRLEVLKDFRAGHSLVSFRGESRDVIGIHREGEQAAVCILLVRGGRISETKNFSLTDLEVSDEEILEGVLQQFYEGQREIPSEILLPYEFDNIPLVASGLTTKRGARVEILAPQRGSKARLLETAELNAKHALTNSFSVESAWVAAAAELASLVGLKQVPRRVECIDISHFQGSETVGAVVVFTDGVADKSAYRKYVTAQQGKADDFASIYEVVTRRLQRGLEEVDLPDLLVIDGGAAQLAMALKARDELRLNLDIIGLAKMRTAAAFQSENIIRKPERIFLPYTDEPILLDEGSASTRFLARIRDEVHRFVITFHRERRAKRVIASKLDSIPGLGPQRKVRLLKHFGTIQKVSEAPEEEIARVGRMPRALAERVKVVLTK